LLCLTYQTKVLPPKHMYAYAYKSLAIQTHGWVKICTLPRAPNLGALSRCPVSVPCLGALSRCPVSVPCLGALSRCPNSVPCLGALSRCPVSVPCLGALSRCPTSVPCLGALSRCPVSVPCLGALSRCPVSVPCLSALCLSALCSALQRLTKKLRLVVDLRPMLVYSRVDSKPTTRSANNEDRT
jgi:hypothetical protein